MHNKTLKEGKEKQAEINEEMQRYTDADENYYIIANTVLTLAQRTYEIFQSSEVAEKRQLLNFLLQNPVLKDKKLMFTLKTPFDTVLEASKCSSMLPSSKLIIIMENSDYIAMMKEKLLEINRIYGNLNLALSLK